MHMKFWSENLRRELEKHKSRCEEKTKTYHKMYIILYRLNIKSFPDYKHVLQIKVRGIQLYFFYHYLS
jgi:hypothetical protein